MLVFEGRASRRLVGRIERGERIIEALGRAASEQSVTAGWISALGAFEWVELVEYDQNHQRYKTPQRFDVPTEILSLTGNVSMKDGEPFIHVHATVSREVPGGIQVFGGHLHDGAVFACEFTIECFDHIVLERERDTATGLSLWRKTLPGEERAPVAVAPRTPWAAQSPVPPTAGAEFDVEEDPNAPPSWASVAARAKEAERPATTKLRAVAPRVEITVNKGAIPEKRREVDESFLDEPIPQVGDWVDHKQFGLCRVDGEDEGGGLIIRLNSGMRRTIVLDFLRVLSPRLDEGRRVFPLEPRKK